MIVVDKISYSIDSVKPRTIRILVLQDEIQISFCDFPVIVVAKNLGGAGEQKGTISGSVNNSTFTERSIGTTAGRFRCFEILDVETSMASDRFKDQLQLV